MKCWYFWIVLALFLASCGFTQTGSAFRSTIGDQGAKAYDEGLSNAEWFVCKAASVGSVQRRYGSSADLADAWRALCLGDPDATIFVPRESE